MEAQAEKQSFWDHLDELRGVILRSLGVAIFFGIIAFFFKDTLFRIVFAPKYDDFVTYRLIDHVCRALGMETLPGFKVDLINTGLARQFIIHLKTAMCAGVICASPYILYSIFSFISPALYTREKKYATVMILSGYVMFMLGVAVSYFVVFPVTFQFLGTYQVDADVTNMIDLDSYMSTMAMMCLCMGIVFELPVLAWLFARLGLLSSSFLKTYRRHAIVVILIVAAIITPTSDAFTLMLVAVPIWLLYEVSVLIVGRVES
ncbi:MAG: twin-arginine translocase subunit TatC [Muribaculaceae bacterium]|nr:twin-arginine translocase subunit TatC [Muribaculaceae bacterium]